jgi:hypothetical protein
MVKRLCFAIVVAISVLVVCTCQLSANTSKWPVHVYCGTGDNLWNHKVEPVDSPATVEAMFEWMSQTYQVKRMYWRGATDDIWFKHFRIGEYKVLQYDWMSWLRYLNEEVDLNSAVMASAKRHGMEVFMYTGLFEYGVQPDVGIICPHLFEHKIRIEHPEWCPLDRWGHRRAPGPISFCYPEARKAIIDNLMNVMVKRDYDGINFYTYVENLGLRYEDEFGYNQPIVDEFNKRYPDVNLRKDTLTEEQKLYWYECRGKFVTKFLTELHDRLAPLGKKLSMILDAAEPNYPQPWWGKPVRGTGKILMEWEKWIDNGIVDEIWVQLGATTDQKALLDRLLVKCAGKPVKLTVRSADPLGTTWQPYIEKGVTPVACITWERNGIERLTLEPCSLQTLNSKDWKIRAQTISDIGHGKISADVNDIAPFIEDPHVLVRHRAAKALAAFDNEKAVALLEKALFDNESCVRIAAAASLSKVFGPQTAEKLLAAVENDGRFQFKLVCVQALAASSKNRTDVLLNGLKNPNKAVKEVSIRALCKSDVSELPRLYPSLRKIILNSEYDYTLRYFAINGFAVACQKYAAKIEAERDRFISDVASLLLEEPNNYVELYAVSALDRLSVHLQPGQKDRLLRIMAKLFRSYGDGCSRSDAAYGWRLVGNAIVKIGGEKGRDILESMRKQTEDKWLAWLAYEVLYVEQKPTTKNKGFNLVDKATAIANHEKYAPEFPGWRKW